LNKRLQYLIDTVEQAFDIELEAKAVFDLRDQLATMPLPRTPTKSSSEEKAPSEDNTSDEIEVLRTQTKPFSESNPPTEGQRWDEAHDEPEEENEAERINRLKQDLKHFTGDELTDLVYKIAEEEDANLMSEVLSTKQMHQV